MQRVNSQSNYQSIVQPTSPVQRVQVSHTHTCTVCINVYHTAHIHIHDMHMYCRLPKTCPPTHTLTHTHITLIVQRGHLLEYSISTHALHPAPWHVTHEVDNYDNAIVFWKNVSFIERVLRKSVALELIIKQRGIQVTCTISSDRGRPHVNLYCEQRKPWWWTTTRL